MLQLAGALEPMERGFTNSQNFESFRASKEARAGRRFRGVNGVQVLPPARIAPNLGGGQEEPT